MFWHIVVLYHSTSYYRESHVVTFFGQGVSRWIKCLVVLSFRAILFFDPSILFFLLLLIFFELLSLGKGLFFSLFSQSTSPSIRKLINMLRYSFIICWNQTIVPSYLSLPFLKSSSTFIYPCLLLFHVPILILFDCMAYSI